MLARGHCHVYFAFLAASQVDLERAQAIARTRPTERARFQRDRRAPAYLDFDPPPLQVTLPCHPLPIGVGRFATEAQVDVTIFDFGAFSVDYRVPFEGPLEDLARLASALSTSASTATSRKRAGHSRDRDAGSSAAPTCAASRSSRSKARCSTRR